LLNHIESKGFKIKDADKNQIILKLATQIQTRANANLDKISKELFNIEPGKHYFQLKQEVIAKSIIVAGKRRYAMYVVNKEGVNVEELDMKGLELMKSNMNKMFKKFGEQVIKDILFIRPKPEIDADIINFYNKLKTTSPKLLGKPTGVKKITEYIERSPIDDEIFTQTKSGAKENTRAAIYYNDILKFKKLDHKYESILEGDKIFVINLKENPYRIDVIGIPNNTVPPEIEEFVMEYIDIEHIFESILANKLKSLYDHIKWEFPNLNPFIDKFFEF